MTENPHSRPVCSTWLTFCAGCFGCSLAGFGYTFGEWSPVVQKAFHYSQEQLDILAMAKDLGGFISIDAGYVTYRFGARMSLAIGILALLVSSMLIFLSVGGGAPFPTMIMFFAIFGHSLSYCDNAAISTNFTGFPRHKGSAVGLMKATEGLTGALANAIFYGFFSQEEMNLFPLFIATTSLVIGLLAVPLMAIATNQNAEEENDERISRKFSLLTVALIMYTGLCGIIMCTRAYSLPMAVFVMLCPLGLFLLTLRGPPTSYALNDSHQVNQPVQNLKLSALEMMSCFDFYLSFFAFTSILGTGLMLSNNFGQMVKAVSMDASASSAGHLTILSIFNTYGRICCGFGSETLKSHLGRPWFLAIAAALMALAFCMLQLGNSFLALSVGLVGFALGGSIALTGVVLEEVFGPEEMPIKYSCCSLAACIGSLTFSEFAGFVYDVEAGHQGSSICLGSSCFEDTFRVATVCNVLAVPCILAVAMRRNKVYFSLKEASRCVEAIEMESLDVPGLANAESLIAYPSKFNGTEKATLYRPELHTSI